MLKLVAKSKATSLGKLFHYQLERLLLKNQQKESTKPIPTGFTDEPFFKNPLAVFLVVMYSLTSFKLFLVFL